MNLSQQLAERLQETMSNLQEAKDRGDELEQKLERLLPLVRLMQTPEVVKAGETQSEESFKERPTSPFKRPSIAQSFDAGAPQGRKSKKSVNLSAPQVQTWGYKPTDDDAMGHFITDSSGKNILEKRDNDGVQRKEPQKNKLENILEKRGSIESEAGYEF